MKGLHGLSARRTIRAFQRAGWRVARRKGSHVHLVKDGNPNILTIPVHSKPLKRGLSLKLIERAGLTAEKFLDYYR